MYYKAHSTVKRLTISREAIEIIQSDAYLSEVLARFGYSEEELFIGLTLQSKADRLYSTQDVEYGNQVARTRALQDQYRLVRNQLRDDRRIAGVVLGDSIGSVRLLLLSFPLGSTYEEVLNQAAHFYREILAHDDLLAVLQPYSFTPETVHARLAQADTLSSAMKSQQFQLGQAQVTTAQRQQAMEALDRWMGRFIGVARQAFKDDPKQLKKLGIYVKG